MNPPNTPYKKIAIGVALVLLVLAVFWPVQHYDFVNYDDNLYVQDNYHLEEGLTAKSLQWMLTATDGGLWHPVTWLSLFVDYRLFGPSPGGFHRTNMLIHALTTVLLFLVLTAMTGSLWKCALAAALFGIHPLHIESVAWIAERKDVLCGLFWMLTMGSYLWYARKPGIGRYLAVCSLFLLGMASKAMIVTLPFLLILLDFYPLHRVIGKGSPPEEPSPWKRAALSILILEKLPLILLAAAASVVAVYSQGKAGALVPVDTYGFDARLANAIVSYGSYLVKTLWPMDLSVFYPLPAAWPVLEILSHGFLLVAISLGVLIGWRRYPYLALGWLWYLGTLVPVIGLVHIGSQAMADRYTYIPLIGIFIILVWGGADLAAVLRLRRPLLLSLSAALVLVPTALSARHVHVWKNDWTLFSQAARAVPGNYLAYNNLGITLRKQGDYEASIAAFKRALSIKPNYGAVYNNLGNTLMAKGAHEEAGVQYRKALEIQPDSVLAHSNLANSLIALGKTEEALRHYQIALRIDPSFTDAHYNLGIALVKQGRIGDGLLHLEKAVFRQPNGSDAVNNLGVALAMQGKRKEAMILFRRALQLNPNHSEAKKNLLALEAEMVRDR